MGGGGTAALSARGERSLPDPTLIRVGHVTGLHLKLVPGRSHVTDSKENGHIHTDPLHHLAPCGWKRLDCVKELAVAGEDVHDTVRSRSGEQSSLRVPREYHRTFAMVPRIDDEQWVHILWPRRDPPRKTPACLLVRIPALPAASTRCNHTGYYLFFTEPPKTVSFFFSVYFSRHSSTISSQLLCERGQ